MKVLGNIDTAKDWKHPKLRAGEALPDALLSPSDLYLDLMEYWNWNQIIHVEP